MKKNYEDYARYNVWANDLWINLLSQMSNPILEREIENSYPSLRLTALHIWDAEIIWLERLKGNILTSFPSENFEGTNVEVFEEWRKTSQEFLELIENLREEDFEEVHNYQDLTGNPYSHKTWEMIHHCFNHSTYHRGQLTTLVRQLGIQHNLPSTDLITYFRILNDE